MTARHRVVRIVGGLALAAALLTCGPGCGNGNFGVALSATPKPYDMREERSLSLSLPQSDGFSIHLSQSTREAGLQGTAAANAQATPDGNGELSAKVENGGRASGTIQLGHSFRNDTSRQMDMTARVRYGYEYQLSSKPEPRQLGATVGIRLFAKEERGRLLRDLPLVTQTTEQGGATRTADEDVSFTITLGPGQTALIYVAANVAVDVIDLRSAEASLRIRDMKMDIQTQLSPAISSPSAGTPPGRDDVAPPATGR